MRTPDLDRENRHWTHEPPAFFYAHNLQINIEEKFCSFDIKKINVNVHDLLPAYTITEKDANCWNVKMSIDQFVNEAPVFVNSYINMMFDVIPNLSFTIPLHNNVRMSQIGMAYILSYMLGMLARYFPTHWVALGRSGKDDAVWPAINGAINYLENAFPLLIWEYIAFRQKQTV